MTHRPEVLITGSTHLPHKDDAEDAGNLGWAVQKVFREELNYHVDDFDIDAYDLSDDSDINNLVDDYGPFENVVWCAGYNQLSWINGLTMSKLDRHFRVNTFSLPVFAASHLQKWPDIPLNIVWVLSDSYRIPMRASMAYGSSKAAAAYMVKNMARELAPLGWRINGVAPGIIDGTPMTEYIDRTVPVIRGWTPEQAREYEQSMIPMGRRLSKLEVAHTIRDVLLGPQGINGSVVEITGGK